MQHIIFNQLTLPEKLLLAIMLVSIFLIIRTIYVEYKEVREIENRLATDKELISEQKKEYPTVRP